VRGKGVLNKDLSIYEERQKGRRGQRRKQERKDGFGGMCRWSHERQVVVVVLWRDGG
jgi:hypothetical protein